MKVSLDAWVDQAVQIAGTNVSSSLFEDFSKAINFMHIMGKYSNDCFVAFKYRTVDVHNYLINIVIVNPHDIDVLGSLAVFAKYLAYVFFGIDFSLTFRILISSKMTTPFFRAISMAS